MALWTALLVGIAVGHVADGSGDRRDPGGRRVDGCRRRAQRHLSTARLPEGDQLWPPSRQDAMTSTAVYGLRQRSLLTNARVDFNA